MNLICLGIGRNQENYLKYLKNLNQNLFGIDKNIRQNGKNFCKKVFKMSIYPENLNIKNLKKILKDNKIENSLYRSSGPSILSLYMINKILRVKRISLELSKCIYSKNYFNNFLKKNKLPYIPSYNKKNLNFDTSKVLKPDSSIIGKNGVFLVNNISQYKRLFKVSKKNSHNKKVIISDYIEGSDISIFFNVKKGKKRLFKILTSYEEVVKLHKNKFFGRGIVHPVNNFDNKNKKKFFAISKKIIQRFSNFYGILSISFKLTNKGKIFPYEINLGLSGDGFADKLFPQISQKLSLYDIETSNIYFNRFLNPKIYRNKYVYYFNNKIVTDKKKIVNIVKK